MVPAELPPAWRGRAAELRSFGAEPQAIALEWAASELERAIQVEGDENLTLAEASAESGYSSRRLRELIADGTIPQAGRKGAPRIRRGDLPKRAPRSGQNHMGYDPQADADTLLMRRAV